MKKFKRIFAAFLAGALLLGLTACDRSTPPVLESGTPQESIYEPEEQDVSKTQLYVGAWDGGLRSDWLYEWKNRFEELHAETSFEDGKKGVQIWVNMSKNYALEGAASSIKNLSGPTDDEVIITEQCNYYTLKSVALDITDVITNPLTEYGETQSILDKMTDSDAEYLGVEENGKTSYYSLPWYQSFFGLNYDIDLFEEKCFYFGTDDPAYSAYLDADGFILDMAVPKSAGPDGVSGTSDDGLPATYDDFFKLCDKMVANGVTPICWTGAVKDYLNFFTTSLANDAMGYDDAMLQYAMDGKETSQLVKSINADGTIVFDNATAITSANGYEMQRNVGKYYALEFMSRLVRTRNADGTTKYYDEARCFSNSESHTSAQARFLRSKPNSEKGNGNAIAMIAEGTWWYNEATPTFNELTSSGYGELDRRIGFMPMPKPTVDYIGEAVYTSTWDTGIVIRKNISQEKVKVAKQFLRYIHTNEALSSFTKNANCIRPYSYELSEEDATNTSYFAKNAHEIYNTAKIVQPWSSNELVIANGAYFLYDIWNTAQGNVVVDVLRSKLDGKGYFSALSKYMNQALWESQFSAYLK